MLGSNNADVIVGGAGNDRLTGRDGNDLFIFRNEDFGFSDGPAFGNYSDVIVDFEQGFDRLLIEGMTFEDAVFIGNSTYTFDNGTNVLSIRFANNITLNAGDFVGGDIANV